MKIPRVVIASPHSGAGKTTVAVGLMNAFASRGLRVQPFKVGPDFIDPSYHTAATRVHSKNLDTWLTSPKAVREIFVKSSRMCNLAVIEGVMGLFDGAKSCGDSASTAGVSKILKAPVILVVDVSRMAGSSVALVHGFKTYDQTLKLEGVILNHVKSQKHLELTQEAIAKSGVRVVGALPSTKSISMPSRHLGLIPALERDDLADCVAQLGRFIEKHLDLDQILEIAKDADELEAEDEGTQQSTKAKAKTRVGIAYDEAFNFYYQDNIELLEANGAVVIPFSPIHDSGLPKNLDGIFLGGGFPETYAKQLEENEGIRECIKEAVEDEMPVYAECGGLMYLLDSILDPDGCRRRMVGILSGRTVMGVKLESLNYSAAYVVRKNLLSDVGFTLRGHEFHYSKIEDVPVDAKFAYEMKIGKGISGRRDGWMQHNLLASYMHIHFAYDTQIARNFVEACRRYELT